MPRPTAVELPATGLVPYGLVSVIPAILSYSDWVKSLLSVKKSPSSSKTSILGS